MIRHQLFDSVLIGKIFYVQAIIFEIPKQNFIIKPSASWDTNFTLEVYELLLLFSIISLCRELIEKGLNTTHPGYIKVMFQVVIS